MEGERSQQPATSRLEMLLQNPDLLSMNVNYQSTREAFIELSDQVTEINRIVSVFEQAESTFAKVTDIKDLQQNIEKINGHIERNSDDFSTEIRELRAYYSFQLKEINSKVDNNVSKVIAELSKPSPNAPAPANVSEGSMLDTQIYNGLRYEIDNLKQRFESLILALSKPITGRNRNYQEFDEEEEEEEAKEAEHQNNNDNPKESLINQPIIIAPLSPPTEISAPSSNLPTASSSNAPSSRQANGILQLNPKAASTSLRTMIEMRFDDIKIQLDKINSQLKDHEEKIATIAPTVQNTHSDIEIMRPEFMKMKADVMLLKGDIDSIKDSQANSVVDFMKQLNEQAAQAQTPVMPDIEKPLLAMRQQFMQQFAKMENAFNEQLRKIKAELIGVKTMACEIKNIPPPENTIHEDEVISVTKEFENEIPAEKLLLEQMQKQAEEERIKKQEELAKLAKDAENAAAVAAAKAKEDRAKEIEMITKIEEEKFKSNSLRLSESSARTNDTGDISHISSQNEYQTAEVQTEFDESTSLKIDRYTEIKTLPNNMVISILADAPPGTHTIVNTPIETKEIQLKKPIQKDDSLGVRSTLAFEYVQIASGQPPDEEGLANVKKDIQRHQEIIERIIDQIAQTSRTSLEVPSTGMNQTKSSSSIPISEFKALKEVCTKNGQAINDLEKKIQQLSDLQKVLAIPADSNDEQQKSQQQLIQQLLQQKHQPSEHVNREIVLSPVMFTPLNIRPLNEHRVRSKTATTRTKQIKPETKNKKNVTEEPKTPPTKQQPEITKASPKKPKQVIELQKIPSKHNEEEDIKDLVNYLNNKKTPEKKTAEGENQKEEEKHHSHHTSRSTHSSHGSSRRQHSKTLITTKPPNLDLTEDNNPPQQEEQPITVEKTVDEEPKEEEVHKNEEEEEEEEERERKFSRESTEFFSAAEYSVGSAVYEPVQYSDNEEEEDEGIDPVIKEKLDTLQDLIKTHQDQIKNIRDGLVEVRTNVQLIKTEMKQPRSYLSQSDDNLQNDKNNTNKNQQNNGNGSISDDNAIRALRRRFDMQTRDFENELYEVRKQVMEIKLEQSKIQNQTVTERIIQVPVNVSTPPATKPTNKNSQQETNEAPVLITPTKKNKNNNLFDDNNKVLDIKSLSTPEVEKQQKVPRIDVQPLIVEPTPTTTSIKNQNDQPTSAGLKKLPPILPPSPSSQNENNQTVENQHLSSSSSRNQKDENSHGYFNNVVQQTINELSVLNAAENVDEHILNLVIEVRSQLLQIIDKNTLRLNSIESKIDNFVDKDYVQKFFQKMRCIITEINSNMTTMKQLIPERVTKEEMQNLIEELYHALTSDQETSGGTTSYRCLLCGRPKTSISGMIKDFKVAETLGQPTQATLASSNASGNRGTLIYGPDKQLYRGKGNFGKPTIAIAEPKKQSLPKMK